ncbi:MAG: hypothetical protein WD036_09460 [Bauldia sp.]
MSDLILAALAYLIPAFAVAFVWHLKLFTERYDRLEIYRETALPAFGLSSMAIQAILFGLVYVNLIVPNIESWLVRGAAYFVFGALLSWSFTTLAVAGKTRMTSIRDYVTIETAFTAVQWLAIALVTALIVG